MNHGFLTNQQIRKFLADYLDINAPTPEPIGAGAWSTCYGFHHNNQDLVIRFGQHETTGVK